MKLLHRYWGIVKSNQKNIYIIASLGASLVLLLITAYVAKHANLLATTDSDGLVNTFLFQNFQFHDMIVPGGHTLLLKWPLLAILALFPYTTRSYDILNYLLFFSTIIGWCVGLTILFGRKYYLLIVTALAVIILGATVFDYSLIYPSLRNIEYPIGLFFILTIRSFLRAKIFTRRLKALYGISLVLFGLAAASDSLMLITFVLPIVIIGVTYWLKGGAYNKRLLQALGLTLLSVAGGFIIQKTVEALGFAIYHYDASLDPVFVKYSVLGPSIVHAWQQFYGGIGGDIESLKVRPNNALAFLKFLVLSMSLIGIFINLSRFFRTTIKKLFADDTYIYAALALGFVLTFVAYVSFGLVLDQQPDGSLTDAGASRYLDIMPLIAVAGLVMTYKLFRPDRQKVILVIFVFLSIAAAALSIHQVRLTTQAQDNNATTLIAKQQAIAAAIAKNHIQFIGSGYWDGASTRFWTNNTISYLSISGCNNIGPNFNVRKSWYTQGTYTTTALLVDRYGSNANYWVCTDAQLTSIYGQPVEKVSIYNTPTSPVLWIYNYDIRTKFISTLNQA